MNIFFILILGIVLYLYFLYNKTEGFQTTSTSYTTDMEAIRILSNVASQLTANNLLTMSGDVKVSNNLNVKISNSKKQIQIGEGEIKFRDDNNQSHYSITNILGNFKISNTSNNINLNKGLVTDLLLADVKNSLITVPYQLTSNNVIYTTSGLQVIGAINGNLLDNKTYFPNSDGINYIRGDTNIDCSNVNINGALTISGDVIISNFPLLKNYITGTFTYTASDNSTTYKAATLSVTTTSPNFTVSGNSIKFNYSGIYYLGAEFVVSGNSGSCNHGAENSGNFSITNASNATPYLISSRSTSMYIDGNNYKYIVSTDLSHTIKYDNVCVPYENTNSAGIVFVPTVGTSYNISMKIFKTSSAKFIIYRLS